MVNDQLVKLSFQQSGNNTACTCARNTHGNVRVVGFLLLSFLLSAFAMLTVSLRIKK